MHFRATDEQIKKLTVLAINASTQVGMGLLQSGAPAKEHEIELYTRRGSLREIAVDYYNGRMVKLWLHEISPGVWASNERLSIEYQSWARRYSTWEALLAAAGINVQAAGETT